MNWKVFYITFAVSFLLSSPTFALLNALGVRYGMVPPPNVHEWMGRPFVHWREETTLFVADPFFLSLLNALALTACTQVAWTPTRIAWVSGIALVALALTALWLRSVPAAEAAHQLRTWGWHWSGPGARTTIAGYWHAIYFFVQLAVGGITLFFLLWQDGVNIHLKAGMVFAAAGYIACFIHHSHLELVRGHTG